ncbi:MAG TPA: hypothetical protein PLD54_04660 [Candidatus Levybacteria bacterium]|nr:hypothetical protein [Candidatus Levybacteria bacterium]
MDPNVQNQNTNYRSSPIAQPVVPPPVQPSGKTTPKKIVWILLGIAILLIIVLGGYLILRGLDQNSGRLNDNFTEEELEMFRRNDKSDEPEFISNLVLQWLDKQRNTDGRYNFGQNCTEVGCEAVDIDNRAGISIIWARMKNYEATGDQQTFQKLVNDINVQANSDVVEVIQTDHWSCKLMYDVWKNQTLDSSLKDKIKSICTRTQQYPLKDYSKADTIGDEYLQQVFTKLNSGSNSNTEDKTKFVSYVTAASDFLALKDWDNRDDLYNVAILHFEKAVDTYLAHKQELVGAAPLLGIAALDFYKANSDQTYLDHAKLLFEKTKTDSCGNLENCLYSSFLAKELYAVTSDPEFQTYYNLTLRINSQRNFDYENFFGYKYGHGAFYYNYENQLYPVLENSLLVGLMSE